jgi:hypothetical protein
MHMPPPDNVHDVRSDSVDSELLLKLVIQQLYLARLAAALLHVLSLILF